jgi:hypothetical protein
MQERSEWAGAPERFPKSVTRFSDKKRDQAKNRERFPIRMKREPL